MSSAVSDKRIPEWLSVICSLQYCGLVCWTPRLVWKTVWSLVLQQLSALAHAWCAGKQMSPATWQMSLSSKTSVIWYRNNMHHSLSPLAAWKPHQCTRAWRHRLKHASETSEGRWWPEMASGWSATSRASLIKQLINGKIVFNACLKAKIKHFEHLL